MIHDSSVVLPAALVTGLLLVWVLSQGHRDGKGQACVSLAGIVCIIGAGCGLLAYAALGFIPKLADRQYIALTVVSYSLLVAFALMCIATVTGQSSSNEE